MASRTGVRVGSGNPVEAPGTNQRACRISEWIPISFRQWAPGPFLAGPVRRKKAGAVGEQFAERRPEFFTILQVLWHGHFLSDLLREDPTSQDYNERHRRQREHAIRLHPCLLLRTLDPGGGHSFSESSRDTARE